MIILRTLQINFIIQCLIWYGKCSETQQTQVVPKLKFIRIGENWKNVTTESTSQSLYATQGDDLFLGCEAPFPIQWNITGLIEPLDVVKIQPPTRNLASNTYQIKVNIFFYAADGYQALAASANIACEKVGNSRNRDLISVFVKGDQTLIQPKTNLVTDSKLIPCPTTIPTSTPSLYLRNSDGIESLVQNVEYYPIEGFRSNTIFNGMYKCVNDGFSVSITAITTSLTEYDFQFSPSSSSIKIFSNAVIEIKCSSKEKPIELKLLEANSTTVEFVVNTEHEKLARLSSVNGANDAGKVVCTEGSTILRKWSYEFIEAPELYIDNYSGEMHCLSKVTPKMAQSVRCASPMDCQLRQECLRNVSMCNFDSQLQFHSKKEIYCWLRDLQAGKECVNLPFYHLNGLIQCTASGLTRQWEFFISLDYRRYSNWKDAPEHELIRMDDVPKVLYTNTASKFFCMASAYLFADSLAFEIEYKNGSRTLLQDNDLLVSVSTISSENQRKIEDLNVASILNINLPIDAVAIHCLAPWSNSTDVMRTSKRFETRDAATPVIFR